MFDKTEYVIGGLYRVRIQQCQYIQNEFHVTVESPFETFNEYKPAYADAQRWANYKVRSLISDLIEFKENH